MTEPQQKLVIPVSLRLLKLHPELEVNESKIRLEELRMRLLINFALRTTHLSQRLRNTSRSFSRSEIFDEMWTHLSDREATNVFHVTKRRLSDDLVKIAQFSGMEIPLDIDPDEIGVGAYSDGRYYLSDFFRISTDVDLFQAHYENAVRANDLSAWQMADDLYGTGLVPSLNGKWLNPERERLELLHNDIKAAIKRLKRK